jgi:hypothetical protein
MPKRAVEPASHSCGRYAAPWPGRTGSAVGAPGTVNPTPGRIRRRPKHVRGGVRVRPLMVWVVLVTVAVALVAALAWVLLTRQQSTASVRRPVQDELHDVDVPGNE